ncbi:MAG: PRC-barrel domain-containing protein [Chloroflexi bacterium]|nr:PRC-barrel domain-containing protein [Chloroflexota bacterium]
MAEEKLAVHHDDTAPMPELIRLRDDAKTVSSSDEDIRGRMVKDSDGQDLGKVDGLLIDAAEEKVRFMEVASGGFLGFGERKSLIPIEAITKITPDEVHISHTRQHVAGAPRYDPDLAVVQADYFVGLYPYYGYQGYMGSVPWTTSWPSRVSGKRPT